MMLHYIVGIAAVLMILGLVFAQLIFGLTELGILDDKTFNLSLTTIALSFVIYYAAVLLPLLTLKYFFKIDFPLSSLVPLIVSIAIVAPTYAFGRSQGGVFGMTTADMIKMPSFGVLIAIDRTFPSPSERVRRAKLESRKEFIRAIEAGELEKVKSTPRDLVDGLFNSNYHSLVAHAAAARNLDMVRWYVELGAKLDRNSEVLRFAAVASNVEILKYLIENGAEPIIDETSWRQFASGQAVDVSACRALPIWQAGETGKMENFKFLLERANLRTDNRFGDYLRACGKSPGWLNEMLKGTHET